MAERSPDVSCAITMAMNSLPGHRRITKKKAVEVHKSWMGNWTVETPLVRRLKPVKLVVKPVVE